ncbi:MAG: hypothetical protein R2942_18770 [Ignavibacteria bacterium]
MSKTSLPEDIAVKGDTSGGEILSRLLPNIIFEFQCFTCKLLALIRKYVVPFETVDESSICICSKIIEWKIDCCNICNLFPFKPDTPGGVLRYIR